MSDGTLTLDLRKSFRWRRQRRSDSWAGYQPRLDTEGARGEDGRLIGEEERSLYLVPSPPLSGRPAALGPAFNRAVQEKQTFCLEAFKRVFFFICPVKLFSARCYNHPNSQTQYSV